MYSKTELEKEESSLLCITLLLLLHNINTDDHYCLGFFLFLFILESKTTSLNSFKVEARVTKPLQ